MARNGRAQRAASRGKAIPWRPRERANVGSGMPALARVTTVNGTDCLLPTQHVCKTLITDHLLCSVPNNASRDGYAMDDIDTSSHNLRSIAASSIVVGYPSSTVQAASATTFVTITITASSAMTTTSTISTPAPTIPPSKKVGRLPALGWNGWNAYHCGKTALYL